MLIEFQASMHSHNWYDLLGEEDGRKAAAACVKVAIFGKPKFQRYTRQSALNRLWDCYGGKFPNKFCGTELDPVILPERNVRGKKEFYDIRDVYKALNNFDKMKFVKIYTDDNTNKAVAKHRSDALEESKNTPAATYSPEVAQRRVRDCYAGNFPGDELRLAPKEEDLEDSRPYSIFDIHDALERSDKVDVLHYPEEAGSYASALGKSIKQQRNTLMEEYKKAVAEFWNRKNSKKYSAEEVNRRVENCYEGKAVLKQEKLRATKGRRYTIIDIRDKCVRCDYSFMVDPTQKMSDARRNVDKEYQDAISSCGGQRYSRDQAERLVRNCYVGNFPRDEAILPIKDNPSKERYSISDIVEAVLYYDDKLLVDRYPAEWEIRQSEREKKMTEIDECRVAIETEHENHSAEQEIENGSGFIVKSQYIITSAHVVSDSDKSVYIYNHLIEPKLRCQVIYFEKAHCIDLTILHCKNLDTYKIQPLQLSDETLLPGMSIFSFGYPFFHPGERALLATGFVSGTDEPFGQGNSAPLTLLNCPLNNGNSGGPLLRLVQNEVKVVGVVTQKHIKNILDLEELATIYKIENSLQTSSIRDFKERKMEGAEQVREKAEKPDPCQTPLNLLTLKLYGTLETHCQFVSSKAVPTKTLREFLCQAYKKCEQDHKEELSNLSVTRGVRA